MDKDDWDILKCNGSEHYQSGSTQPIDLYVAGDMFLDFALGCIIKYAFRSRRLNNIDEKMFINNMTKIIDYAEKLIAYRKEG